jgi:hypothetical protein
MSRTLTHWIVLAMILLPVRAFSDSQDIVCGADALRYDTRVDTHFEGIVKAVAHVRAPKGPIKNDGTSRSGANGERPLKVGRRPREELQNRLLRVPATSWNVPGANVLLIVCISGSVSHK